MAIQTSFAKKMTGSEHCNHRFLALLGNDGEFDLAFLDVKNRVRHVPLYNIPYGQKIQTAGKTGSYALSFLQVDFCELVSISLQ